MSDSDKDDIFGDGGHLFLEEDLQSWVMDKCNEWRDHYESNYADRHDEYMRIFRNQYSTEDKTRESERSQLIAPATAQAIESNVAEVEEATFGRGQLFDIKDDVMDKERGDIGFLKNKLHEDFALARIRSSVAECLVNAAVYGTGVAEVVLEETKVYKPATRPAMEGQMSEIGVQTTSRPLVKLNPVQPKNFLIDPVATSIDAALGCAIDEFVSRHIVEELQEMDVYTAGYVGEAAADDDIEPDREVDSKPKDRIRLTKYYGKVPRDLLIDAGVEEEDIEEDGHYVESIVVIANEGFLLKAIPNPYMCQDRPVVAFQWDIVPSVFWGRGVAEKAYMSQKALDAELRARIDALALTTHPMMAVDATRIPRGHKLEVRPGRMLLTNGAPRDSIMPFNFGSLSEVTFAQAAQLQAMVSQSTGAADGVATPTGDVTAAGQSMSQGAMIKRQKRTLVNFQENFLLPFISKAAYRYMQFDPDNYPVQDYKFVAYSSLGAMAREYEVAQLSQILQVVPPDSPAHAAIIKGILDHLNVSNREELVAIIDQANQPDPQAQQQEQQIQQQKQQIEMAIAQGQVSLLQAQASESSSRAVKYQSDIDLEAKELVLKYSDVNQDGAVDRDFNKKVELAKLKLREKEIDNKAASDTSKQEAALMQSLMENSNGGAGNPTGLDEQAPTASQPNVEAEGPSGF